MKQAIGLAGSLLATGLIAGCGADGPQPSENAPQHVIVLVIDALNADHLGSYDKRPNRRIDLTPNLDRIADEGMRFENAYSNNTWTLPSTASMMTGLLQEHHGVVRRDGVVPDEASLLPELFQDAGWKTRSFVQMTYASKLFGFDQGFDATSEYGFGGGPGRADMAGEVVEWMEDNEDERYFLYLHFRRPHGVYNAHADVRARVTPGCELAGTQRGAELQAAQDFAWMDLAQDEKKHIRHLYRANLAMVDETLGPILELARAEGTLLVVTSDHGEGLGEHDFYGHGPSVFRENIHIPLIYRGPGIEVGVDTTLASTVDLRPTLVEVCELFEPADTQRDGAPLGGRLVGATNSEQSRPVAFSGRYGAGGLPAMGRIDEQRTLFKDSKNQWHLYYNANDPAQANNWYGTDWEYDNEDMGHMSIRSGIVARREKYTYLNSADAGKAPELTAEDQADLRALGYGGD